MTSRGHDTALRMDFVSYQGTREMTHEGLFSGFDEATILTYSSDIPFLRRTAELIPRVSLVVGTKYTVHHDMATLIASQCFAAKSLRNDDYLLGRVEDGTLDLHVLDDVVSHAKAYCLSAADGRRRTVLGSANATTNAWGGRQGETYIVSDDPVYYDHVMGSLRELIERSTTHVERKSRLLRKPETELADLPVVEKVIKAKEAVLIHSIPDVDDEVVYDASIAKASSSMADLLRSRDVGIRPRRSDGMTLVAADRVRRLVAVDRERAHGLRDARKATPNLLIDYDAGMVTFDGSRLPLTPTKAEVRRDADLWLEYLAGFEGFVGDTSGLTRKAWMLMVHMFVSPTFAHLRLEGSRAGIDVEPLFPVYCLFRGPSNNGKTTLVRAVQHLMLGHDLARQNKSLVTSALDKGVQAIMASYDACGCPILIDDITGRNWSYMGDIVRNADLFLSPAYEHHPTFVLTANSDKYEAVAHPEPALTKRIVIFDVDARCPTDENMTKVESVPQLRRQMGSALWRAYMARLLPEVDRLVGRMWDSQQGDGTENVSAQALDVYAISANVLADTLEAADVTPPGFLRDLDWYSFMGERAISERCADEIRRMWRMNPQYFSTARTRRPDGTRTRLLRIDLGERADGVKVASHLANDMPTTCEAEVDGTCVMARLDRIQDWLGVRVRGRRHR